MKAYSDAHDPSKVRLFRPEMNMRRFLSSCHRLALPDFDPEELEQLIRRLVPIDKAFVPRVEEYSLNIRPFAFACDV